MSRAAPNRARGSSQEPVVEFRNVTVSFDGPPVLNGVSLTVGPRETRIAAGSGRGG